jgi:hypothetical protein
VGERDGACDQDQGLVHRGNLATARECVLSAVPSPQSANDQAFAGQLPKTLGRYSKDDDTQTHHK